MWNNSNNPLQSCWHTITTPPVGPKELVLQYTLERPAPAFFYLCTAGSQAMFPNPITFRGMCLLQEEAGWKSANMLRGKLLNKYSKDVTLEYIQKRQELLPNTICNFTQNQECTPGKESAYLLTTCCSLSLSNFP